jgi:hypothetical protein
MADRLRGSVLGTALAGACLSYFYVPMFLDRTAGGLNERYDLALESAWSTKFGWRWLKRWANGIERATDGRITARAALWWLVVYPIGMPRLQHALNQHHALPPARVIAP